MFNRLIIFTAAAVALFAIEAHAATCVQYRTSGGTKTCTKWSTGSVIFQGTFDHECGADGSNCSVSASASSNNNIVFCGDPDNPTKVTCTDIVTYSGNSGPSGCIHKHNKDTVSGTGGHEINHMGCVATFEMMGDACQTACGTEPFLDVTPVEMFTFAEFCVGGGVELDEITTSASTTVECNPESSCCSFNEHCTISPKSIGLDTIKEYKCELLPAPA